MLSYDSLSRKPILLESFTGLSVKQFDDIFKEIESKYTKHEIKRLLSTRKHRERSVVAGRYFKLDVKDRLIMVLVYYRLYITYTLMEFLFDLNQSNICRDIQKIEELIRSCLPIPQKLYNVTEVKDQRRGRTVLSWFYGSCGLYRATDSKTPEQVKKKTVLFWKEKETHHGQDSVL